jgi:AraC-like DNA-binding protein
VGTRDETRQQRQQFARLAQEWLLKPDGHLDVHIDTLAAEFGTTRRTLQRAIEEAGLPGWRRMVRERRIEIAKDKLKRTTDTIEEICQACGYSHQPQFAAAFREETGLQPIQWRLKYGNKKAKDSVRGTDRTAAERELEKMRDSEATPA